MLSARTGPNTRTAALTTSGKKVLALHNKRTDNSLFLLEELPAGTATNISKSTLILSRRTLQRTELRRTGLASPTLLNSRTNS